MAGAATLPALTVPALAAVQPDPVFAAIERCRKVTTRTEPPAQPYTPPAEGGLTKARTATEVYRARLAELEYEERVEKLLLVDDVDRSMRECADVMRGEIELWPTRADELAAAFQQSGVQGMRLVLKTMSRDLLITLAKNMRVLGAAPAATPAPAQDVS